MNSYILKLVDTVCVRITTNPFAYSILSGTSLWYAIQNNKYQHIPLELLIPIFYSGYQAFKNKETIKQFIYS